MSCGFCIFYRQKPTLHIRCCSSSLSGSFNSLRWKLSWKADDAAQFEKRWQSAHAFDHNRLDRFPFLRCVLQDTRQGETFFKCVTAWYASGILLLTLLTVGGIFSRDDPTRVLWGILGLSLKVEEPLLRSGMKT